MSDSIDLRLSIVYNKEGHIHVPRAADNSWAPLRARCACGCDGLPKVSGTCDNPESSMGVMVFPATSFRTNQLAVLGCVDIAECTGVGKVKLDDIITVVG